MSSNQRKRRNGQCCVWICLQPRWSRKSRHSHIWSIWLLFRFQISQCWAHSIYCHRAIHHELCFAAVRMKDTPGWAFFLLQGLDQSWWPWVAREEHCVCCLVACWLIRRAQGWKYLHLPAKNVNQCHSLKRQDQRWEHQPIEEDARRRRLLVSWSRSYIAGPWYIAFRRGKSEQESGQKSR